MNPRQRYLENLKVFSERLIEIQKPIQILDSIKWPTAWRDDFFASHGKELPPADLAYYQSIPLKFDINSKTQELQHFRQQLDQTFGKDNPLVKILANTAEQYLQVLTLIQSRGTPKFGEISRELYGSAHQRLTGDRRTLLEIGQQLCTIFSQPAVEHISFYQPKIHSAPVAVDILQEKLSRYFTDGEVQVKISDGIVSDAAAGGDSIKLNARAFFSDADLRVLEVHEGWVHVGTTLNGRRQPWAKWLSVGSPRISAIQEGLAVLLETLTFSSFPLRARKVSDRVYAIYLAEEGADFVQVFRHLRDRGLSEMDAYAITQRVFRGGICAGGAQFTKDLSYVKGFVENVNFIRSAIAAGMPELIPMLFVGKINLDDIPVLYEAYLEGIVEPPQFLPDLFRDLNGLYVWFGFSSGMALVNIQLVQRHFLDLFERITPVCPVEMAPKKTRREDSETLG